jgi:hypothetical protein
MRRPWNWLLAGNALLVLGLFCFTWNYQDQRITKKNVSRIKEGMTLSEVEVILGPERDELEGRGFVFPPANVWKGERVDGVQPISKKWIGKSYAIVILAWPDGEHVLTYYAGTPFLRNPAWSERLEARWEEWWEK